MSAVILQLLDGRFKVIYVAGAFVLAIYYAFMMEVDGRYNKMTGVYSKRFYYSEIERLPKDEPYLVAMLDANGLKKINDTKGHENGDLAIEAIGQSLWRRFSTSANVFRIGGDEFVILSTMLSEEEFESGISEIREYLKQKSDKLGFGLSISVGVSIHEASEDFAETLRRADARMYEKKSEHYNRQ